MGWSWRFLVFDGSGVWLGGVDPLFRDGSQCGRRVEDAGGGAIHTLVAYVLSFCRAKISSSPIHVNWPSRS